MKKLFKILGISLGSIIALVVIVTSAAVWVIFTPERLTPIVRNVANEYVECEHHIDKVELTFFSTFPHFGLAIDGLTVVNPMEGVTNDTVLHIPHAVVSVDIVALLNKQVLSIPTLSMLDMQANMYIAADGQMNYNVLAQSKDTITKDTAAFTLPFEQIVVGELTLSAKSLQYISIPDSIHAKLCDVVIDAEVNNWEDILLTLDINSINATLGNTTYAQGMRLQTTLPIGLDLKKMRVSLCDANIAVNNLSMALNGWAEIGDTLQTDMRLTLSNWQMDSVMPLLPLTLSKDVIQFIKGGSVSLDATAAINMADGDASSVTIHHLNAHAKQTELEVRGEVTDPLGNLWMDLSAQMDVKIADVKAFLPEGMQVGGKVAGTVSAQMYLEDLMAMELEKGKIAGDMLLKGITYHADSTIATLPNNRLTFKIPNSQASRKEVNWLTATLYANGGEVTMSQSLQAILGETNIDVETSNLLSDSPYLHATLALQSSESLQAIMDSTDITVTHPKVHAYVAYHMKDSSVMPTIDAELVFDRLKGYYTDIQLDVQPSVLTTKLHAPRLLASLQTQALAAQMGEEIKLNTQNMAIEASARYNKKGGENLLLKWNPTLSIDLKEAEIALANWDQTVKIPTIDFTYTNRDCKIEESQIIIGESDFQLTGELKNIGRWMRNKGTLFGELNFVSEHTDINELLALFSADQGAEETEKSKEEKESTPTLKEEESAPFLVPTNVDLTLNTRIKEAVVFNQTARELGGKVYVRDGILIVEEMGFICNAAKLQLTAMYRTPRRNHIYVGFDYHMLDINIQELIGMIPQLDSMMPMLRSFRGEAEFHLAAETYTNAQYEIKPSTIRGAASIFGKDLVVLDNETFSKISKLLMFSKKTENKVDSISAEMTIYKKEIDVYPFCVSIDNYMVALGGRHNLDMTFNYDVNVLSPIYLGVNVSGDLDDLDIKLAPCKFAKDFKPLFHRKVDTHSAELRSMIRESMRKNVK